jgi:formylglycine-generating enzyme required for sulfatase activity
MEALLGLPVVWVPPGPFLMSSDKERDPQADRNELLHYEVTLPGYWIGRYPVTVAQFRALAWASVIWLASLEGLTGPGNHPVVNVTLDNALGFCHWLSEKTGLEVMLPSEAEWEKAARGGKQIPNLKSQDPRWVENPAPARVYPWGDDPPDESRCNLMGTLDGPRPWAGTRRRGQSLRMRGYGR